jgi:hypothetical protein
MVRFYRLAVALLCQLMVPLLGALSAWVSPMLSFQWQVDRALAITCVLLWAGCGVPGCASRLTLRSPNDANVNASATPTSTATVGTVDTVQHGPTEYLVRLDGAFPRCLISEIASAWRP